MLFSVKVFETHILLHAEENGLQDWEKIRRHPLLLRLRLWLAMSRIKRRQRKIKKFCARQAVSLLNS